MKEYKLDLGKGINQTTEQYDNHDEQKVIFTIQKTNTLMGVKLNKGIEKYNLLSFYLCYGATIINVEFLYTFVPLILTDKQYYNMPLNKMP